MYVYDGGKKQKSRALSLYINNITRLHLCVTYVFLPVGCVFYQSLYIFLTHSRLIKNRWHLPISMPATAHQYIYSGITKQHSRESISIAITTTILHARALSRTRYYTVSISYTDEDKGTCIYIYMYRCKCVYLCVGELSKCRRRLLDLFITLPTEFACRVCVQHFIYFKCKIFIRQNY